MQFDCLNKPSFPYGNWRGLYALVEREVGRFIAVAMQTIVAPVVTTILFYIIFALAFGGLNKEIQGTEFLAFLAPGLIMMAMVQNAFANSSSSLIIGKIQGTVSDLLLAPLSAQELYWGHLIGAALRGLMVGLICYIAMVFFTPLEIVSAGKVIGFAILGTMMLGSLGILAGVWAERFDHVATITNFVVTPLSFLSGTFYSMETLPEFWQKLAHFNPFFYMIDGFRSGFIGWGDTDSVTGMTVLICVNVFLGALVVFLLKIGYKIKS